MTTPADTPPGVPHHTSAAVYTGVMPTEKRKRRLPKVFGRAVFAVIAVGAITTAVTASFLSSTSGPDPRAALTLIAPAGVGGGWDGFAREQQQAMRSEGVVNNVQVTNIPGAGGTIGLSAFASRQGETSTLLATGAAMVGGIEINDSTITFDDVRPIARVAEDYAVFVANVDFDLNTIEQLAERWKNDPKSIRFTGGSAGSIDHLLVAQFAQAIDVPAAEMVYIPKSGGGEAIQTVLARTADVAVTGYNEVADQIEAGRVKAFALSAPRALDGVDIPTFEDRGIEVNLVNWRGWLAPGDISDEGFNELKAIVQDTLETDAWAESLARNRWVSAYEDGDAFLEFLREDQARTSELIGELGL